jgi:glycosidase
MQPWRIVGCRATAAVALWLAWTVCAEAAEPDIRPVPARPGVPHLPPHWQHGAFMEIFVRAYQDSDGDGIGDLRGLISRLDHLQDLGVRGLWLMPVMPSADRDHGYATTDYRAIEPAYGTLADFDELLRQAHRRGIGVIVDYVLNHSAASHPMFVDARQGPGQRFRDWYVWADTHPAGWDIWGHDPWYHAGASAWAYTGHPKTLPPPAPGARDFYFGTFNQTMPDFNFRHPEVLRYHEDSLRFWLNRGLDGFRLDAVPHLVENSAKDWNDQPESRAITRRVRQLVLSYPRRYVVCEATAAPQAWGDPALCGGAFAFDFSRHLVPAAKGDPAAVQALAAYYTQASPTMASFVSNHDIFAGRRLWDQLQGDEAAYKAVAAAYLLMPGTPFIYYGEELGQAGVPGLDGDLPLRAPMSWAPDPRGAGFTTGAPFRPVAPNVMTHNAQAQLADPDAIYGFYRAMLALRNGWPSIARGAYEAAFADGAVLGFQRRLGPERTLVLVHFGQAAATVEVPGLVAGERLWPLYGDTLAHAAPPTGALHLRLAPQSVQVYSIRPPR